MHITLSPIRQDARPVLEKRGDTILIDGEAFDFSQLREGQQLPNTGIETPWICGDVMRIGGVLHLSLLLSHGSTPPRSTAHPVALNVLKDGPIDLPPYDTEETPA